MENSKYTPEEIQSKINILNADIEMLDKEIKEIGKQINSKRKRIKYWRELDESQLKMF